jgi:zinc/manganese transport system substrate-binding protein
MRRTAARPLAALVLLLAACAGPADTRTAPGAPLRIAVTTSVLGDVVSDLVEEDAEVEVIMPRGADPHSFQPSAAQAEAMRTADLLVVNGADAEEGMLDVIEAAAEDGVRTVEAIAAVDTLDLADEHGHDGVDPHFWQDPSRMAEAVVALAAEIAEVDQALGDSEWTARGEALAAELRDLDAEVEQILAAVPDDRRTLVTNHEAFGYFADRYGFEVLGTVIPGGGTLAEPSASGLEELVGAIEQAGVTAIFAENTNPSALADAVAAEVGTDIEVALLFTDSLSEPGEGAGTYAEMLRSNATTVAEALG